MRPSTASRAISRVSFVCACLCVRESYHHPIPSPFALYNHLGSHNYIWRVDGSKWDGVYTDGRDQ